MGWLEDIRSQIPSIRDRVYLNNASSGPLPMPVIDGVRDFIDYWGVNGEPWDIALDKIVELKRLYAGFIGASMEEVAYAPGVTYALQIILSSIRFPRDSNIVVSMHNFPTSLAMAKALERSGVVKEVRVVVDRGGYTEFSDYEKLIDDNTALALIDYVGWLSGYVEDIKGIADLVHDRDGILVSDMFHAIGAIPVDVKRLGVDVAITGSYKWLMSLHGAALIYVSKGVLDRLKPMYMGWLSIDDSVFQRRRRGEDEFKRPFNPLEFNYPMDASRFEHGTPPLTAFIALYEALKFHLSYGGPKKYEIHTKKLTETLRTELINIGYKLYTPIETKSTITTIKHKNPQKLAQQLNKNKIETSPRPGLLRISPHHYNTQNEIHKLIKTLKNINKQT